MLDISYDETSPTNTGIVHVNFEANEAIGLEVSAITVVNGVLGGFTGNGSSWSGEITPYGDGDIVTSVAEGTYQDEAGNWNTVSASANIEVDWTAPQITIEGPSVIYSGGTAEMTYTATEPILGFENTDIEVDNGVSVNFTGNGDLFNSVISDAVPGTVTVNIAENSYTDIAGNLALPSDAFIIDVLTGTVENPAINGLKVYPNPATSFIKIVSEEAIKLIELCHMDGTLAQTETATQNGSGAKLDISGLPPGLYIVKVFTGTKVSTTKISKR
ncbi:MAG: hypothetical protein DRJ05_01935 [Bacteroidetes bacterium]|nr:MAG: hypothetical protein DRJ05_01935 [Bacteroidota bacterium]